MTNSPPSDFERAEVALRASEDKYRSLFNSLDQGVSTLEILCDDGGAPIDFRFLENNHAMKRALPVPLDGRCVKEVVPDIDPWLIEAVGRVATSGEPARFEYAPRLVNRIVEVRVSRVGGEGSRTVVAIFNDITVRKRREANLAFLAEVTEELARLNSLAVTMAVLGPKIGAHFKASRCNFAEISEATAEAIMTHEWHAEDLPEIFVGRVHRLRDFVSEDLQRAASAGEVIVVRDTATDPRTSNAAYAPFRTRAFITANFVRDGQWRFVVSVADQAPRDWRPDEVELLGELAGLIWMRLERERAEEELRRAHASLEQRVRERTSQIEALFKRLVSAQEEERRRIARDIHDQLGQQMTALRMNLEALRAAAEPDPALLQQTQRAQHLAEELDRSIDFLTWELRPMALDHLGLPAALQNLVHGWSERFGVAAEVVTHGTDGLRLGEDTEANLYRIAQEALHNIVKHARATHVAVLIERRHGQVLLVIEDNGDGFDPPDGGEGGSGMGLVSMRERAMLAGATLDIDSAPGRGTTVFVRMPVGREEPNERS